MIGEPRVQPVCAAYDGKLYVWGGFYQNGKSSIVATSGLRYLLQANAGIRFRHPVMAKVRNSP